MEEFKKYEVYKKNRLHILNFVVFFFNFVDNYYNLRKCFYTHKILKPEYKKKVNSTTKAKHFHYSNHHKWIPYISNSRWQTRKKTQNRSTNNGDK